MYNKQMHNEITISYPPSNLLWIFTKQWAEFILGCKFVFHDGRSNEKKNQYPSSGRYKKTGFSVK
jgi:hypothetical protein